MYQADGDVGTDHRGLLVSSLVGLLLGAFAVGCDGCDRGPSVPFAIGGSAAPSASSSNAPTTSGSAGPTEASPPPDPEKLVLGEHTVAAPEGKEFALVLGGDADGDQLPDALAWATDSSGGGELLFYAARDRGEARPPLHVEKPRPGCRPKPELRRLGRETFALGLRFACDEDAGVREALRWVVVRAAGSAAGHLETRMVVDRRAAPPGEHLDLEPRAADRDGDGREDLLLLAELAGAPAPFRGDKKANAEVVYLDRPAGYTLDPTEPARSLGAAATALYQQARRPSEAAGVDAAIVPLVRLAAALCGDLGAPLVTTDAGPLRCGEVDAVGDAFAAAGLAALTRGDLAAAIGWGEAAAALGERAGPKAKDVARAIEERVPLAPARVVGRVPRDPEGGVDVAAPPLAWDTEGRLHVARGSEVVTLGDEGKVEPSAAAPWPREVRWSARGQATSLVSVTRRCGPTSLVATLDRAGGRFELGVPDRETLVPVGARAEPCTAGRVDVGVLALGADRAVFALGASLVEVVPQEGRERAGWAEAPTAKDPPGPPGGARATDGLTLALMTGGDAVVLTPARARRWRAPEIASSSTCSPSPGGTRLACVGARAVLLLEPSR